MSAPRKLRATPPGLPVTEPGRFKELWRKSFTSDFKLEFLGWFNETGTTNALIRSRLAERFGIKLKHDGQLSGEGALWQWCLQEQRNAAEAEWVVSEEENLKAQGLSGDQLRAELLDRMKRRALVRGDHKLGLAAIDRDIKVEALAFDQEKFKESLRTKIQAGLDAIAAEAGNNPKIKAALEAIQEATKT